MWPHPNSRLALACWLTIVALVLAGCAAPAPSPTRLPTAAAIPATATPLPPTAAVAASAPTGPAGIPGPLVNMHQAISVAFDADGNMFLSDCDDAPRILKVNRANLVTVYAGTGIIGFSGDGGPATSATLTCPELAFGPDGDLYFSDLWNYRVRRIDRKGIITTVAGSGPSFDNAYGPGGFLGDGGPATSARLGGIGSIAFDARGDMYLADPDNNRVRMVDTQGIITTVAGSGVQGFSGDGGPATAAQFNASPIMGIAVDGAGNLYLTDTVNYRVRKVDTRGIITTVVGNGEFGTGGDGGAATDAQLNWPTALAFDADGNLYVAEVPVADGPANRVLRVDKNGIITTVAGSGPKGFSGDGGPAAAATLSLPNALVCDSEGKLYIVDRGNNRVRKVNKNGIISTVVGGGTLTP